MARDPDEISLLINGVEFRFWQNLVVERAIDSYSTISFAAPFEPDNAAFRDTFRPFSFKLLHVRIGGELLFPGYLVGVLPSSNANSRTVNVTGYALPGSFGDCTMPPDSEPLEFKKVGLRDIAKSLLEPFALSLVFDEEQGAVFKKVKLEPGGKPQDFLVGLAKQRKLVINNTADGAVRFWKSITTGAPVARLNGNKPPVTTVTPSFNPQGYFSEITGFAATKRGKKGSRYTVQNDWLSDTLRPHAFQTDDTDPADTPTATSAKLGRMFGEAASYTLPGLPTWRDPSGELWEPNTFVTLLAPDAMIYEETKLLIRSVTLMADAEKKTARLGLVLPGAYSGEVPESLPWLGSRQTEDADGIESASRTGPELRAERHD